MHIFVTKTLGEQSEWTSDVAKQGAKEKENEVCSNEASTKQRKLDVDGRQIIVYKPVVSISKENKGALQFLDLMSTIDKYSEVSGDEFAAKLKAFVTAADVDFGQVKKYLQLFPDRVYRNIYQGV